jgi:hypothetical protein
MKYVGIALRVALALAAGAALYVIYVVMTAGPGFFL